jgi:hypothetical protein
VRSCESGRLLKILKELNDVARFSIITRIRCCKLFHARV